MKTKIILAMVFFSTAVSIWAQQTGMNILEKDYEISRKAKKGYLGGVEAKPDGGFDMVYFLPSSRKKVKIETYSFDKDANLKNTVKDEWDVEKVKKKWKFFNFKGDEYVTTSAAVSANMMGKLMFKKREIKAKYNWLSGDYVKRVKLLDRQKLTNELGEEYYFGGAYEVERDSAIYVMGYPINKTDAGFSSMDLLKVSNMGNVKKILSVPTSTPMMPIFSKPLLDEQSPNVSNDDFPRDWILVLAPTKIYGKNNGNAKEFVYFKISPEGTIKENFNFTVPTSGFRIINAFEKDGSVLLYGLAIKKEGKFASDILGTTVSPSSMDDEEQKAASSDGGMFGGIGKMAAVVSGKNDLTPSQGSLDNALDEKKWELFFIAKVSNGKIDYVKTTEIPELNQKAVAGADMKKPLEFDGKKFKTNNFQVLKDGSMMLCLQDFKPEGKGFGGNKLLGTLTGTSTSTRGDHYDRIYKGMFMLHFAPDGSLIRNYTVQLDQKNKRGFFNNSPMTADNFPTSSYIIESKDGKSINWIMEMVKAIDKDTSSSTFLNTTTTTTSYSPFYSIEYGKLDLSSGKSSEFRTLGDLEKKKYYLYEKHNRMQIGDYTYFFSETPSGDRLLISRMNINE